MFKVTGLPGSWAAPPRDIKKAGAEYLVDISASRLSQRDPVGFPPHPRGWFSIIVIKILFNCRKKV